MLKLTRKPSQGLRLILEDGRVIRVSNAGPKTSAIGVNAPKSIRVLRDELPVDRPPPAAA